MRGSTSIRADTATKATVKSASGLRPSPSHSSLVRRSVAEQAVVADGEQRGQGERGELRHHGEREQAPRASGRAKNASDQTRNAATSESFELDGERKRCTDRRPRRTP